MKKIGFFLCFLLLLLASGCARTVTPKSEFFSLDIRVNFRGNVDLSKYQYLIALSSRQQPLIPIPLPHDYFPLPSQTYDQTNQLLLTHGGLNYYYKTYFSTWSDFVVLSQNGVRFVKSSAQRFDANTQDSLAYFPETNVTFAQSVSGTQLRIVIPLQYLSDFSSQIYLNMGTLELKDSTQSGIVWDALRTNFPVFSSETVNNTGQTIQDSIDSDVPDAADIISWEVRVF